MTLEQYRKELLDRYIESGLRSENVQKTVIISPYKIETYYNNHADEFKVPAQVKLRMIVLNKASPDDTNALGQARDIARKVKAGASLHRPGRGSIPRAPNSTKAATGVGSIAPSSAKSFPMWLSLLARARSASPLTLPKRSISCSLRTKTTRASSR